MPERSDLGRELNEARTRIAQLEAELAEGRRLSALAQMTSGVAHDFSNVLATIGGYTDLMLRATPEPSPIRHGAEAIQKAVEWGHRLTEQLLGRTERPAADLNSVVSGVVRTLAPLLGDSIDVELTLDPLAGTIALAPAALEQIVMNLVLNARDAMPRGGRLTVTTAAVPKHATGGGTVTLAVVDTGIGMDAATRARAFEPYFSTKAGTSGKGLGLSTVFGIVTRHGGDVDVVSEPGRGSTFRICLPLLEVPRPEMSAPPTAPRTIVVLEDDPRVRDLIAEIVESDGYRALRAATVDEALGLAGRNADRVVLVVAAMRALEGPAAEFADWLHAVAPGAALLCLTDEPGGSEGTAALMKPFTVEALVDAVRRLLKTPATG